MLLTVGDSFTYGTELTDRSLAWPYQLGKRLDLDVVNLAEPGASNDFILRTTVSSIERYNPTLVVVAFTTPNRFERNGEHYTPTKNPNEFREWNEVWALDKFHTQVALLESYIKCEHYLLSPWDVESPHCIEQLVALCEGFDKGPGGHPLEQGHDAIAKGIYDLRTKIVSKP